MTVDRSLFAKSFETLPAWPCPTCGKGHYVAASEPILTKETGPSRAMRDHDAWDPDWMLSRFAGLLECNFANCGEVAAISGYVRVDEFYDYDYEGQPSQEYRDAYVPLSISPAPLPIRPPIDTPELITDALSGAAGLIWQSPEAAANQVRKAVEHLMDYQGITKSLPKSYKTLDSRIKEFALKDAKNAEILLATKWLGNSGSHAGGLKRSDVLDAFDFIELVLVNLYDQTTAQIIAKAQAINVHKGPVKPSN